MILKSTIPSTTFPALPSMFTGLNPGNLGVFSWIKSDGSLGTIGEIQYPKLWDIIEKLQFIQVVIWVKVNRPDWLEDAFKEATV